MTNETNTVLKHFQIYRNNNVSVLGTESTHATAVANAKTKFAELTGLLDGELVLYRYKLGDESTIHTIVGVHYLKVEGDNSISFYEILGNYDQLSAEYKAHVDSAIAGLDGSATIASVAEGVVTLKAGIAETDGKIANNTEADIKLAKVATTGKAEDVAVASIEGLTANTVQRALAELQGDIAALDAAQLSAGNGIDIANHVVSAKVAEDEKVLSVNADGLKTTLTVDTKQYTAEESVEKAGKTYIQIKGIGGEVISETDAAAFVKDGMLNTATIVKGTWTGESFTESTEGQDKAIKLVWNTDAGKDAMFINAETLVDSYTSGNEWIAIEQATNKISHKTSGVAAGTYATNTANVTVDSTTEKSFKVPTLTVDAAGHVTAASEKTVTITLPAEINTAVQEVTGDTYVSATKNGTTVTLKTKTQSVEGATAAEGETPAVDGLATALDVKTYVDGKIANVNTVIENLNVDPFSLTTLNDDKLEGYLISEVNGKIEKGQTAETLLTFASAPSTNNKVATQAEIAALDANVASANGQNVQVQVKQENGVITSVSVVKDTTVNATDVSNAITTAIEGLDSTKYNVEALTNGTATNDIRVEVVEENGVLTAVNVTDTLAKVAHSGNAADVNIADTDNVITATTVEDALVEIAKEINAMDSAYTPGSLIKVDFEQVDGKVTNFTTDETALENRLQGLQNATTLEGVDAIDVSYGTGDDSTNTVSLKLAEETILTQNGDGLKATLSIVYNSDDKQIELHGVNGVIGEPIDATDFIKDGMLEDAEIITATNEEGLVAGKRYIKFTFKTYQQGQKDVEELLKVEYLDVENLFDSYTSGNDWIEIDQTNNKISHAEVGAAGTYAANAANVTVDSTTSQSFKVPTLTVDAAGHVTAASEKTVTITLPAFINTAVQKVTSTETVNDTDKFVAVNATRAEGSNDVVLTTKYKTKAVADATETANGLATALNVKEYVDAQVGKANTAITDAIAKLDANVTNIETLEGAATTNDIKVSISEVDGKLTDVTVVDTLAKVAHTGKAADMSIADTNGKFEATTVEDALLELVSVDTWDAGTY